MNTRFFNKLGLMTVMGLTMIACSQNEDATDNLTSNIGEDGLYHYTMTLNCTTAGFEGEGVTRAVTYDQWNDGATLYVRFLSGSSYVTGTATYNKTANVWDVSAPSTLATTASDTNCEVYYFVNPEGTSTSAVTMSEKTACFFTTAATSGTISFLIRSKNASYFSTVMPGS